jgi:type VI secretion system Hcp family effector
MALNAYIKVTGTKQGSMKGSTTRKGHGSWSEVISIRWGNLVFAASGQSSGKRQHQPVTIRKEVDAASPQLLQALWSNEAVDIAVEVSGTPGTTLKNGTIVSIDPYFGPAPWGHSGKRYEEIVVTFPELSSSDLQHLTQLSQGA